MGYFCEKKKGMNGAKMWVKEKGIERVKCMNGAKKKKGLQPSIVMIRIKSFFLSFYSLWKRTGSFLPATTLRTSTRHWVCVSSDRHASHHAPPGANSLSPLSYLLGASLGARWLA